MKKLIYVLVVVSLITIPLSMKAFADEMNKISAENGDFVEYRETKVIKDTKGVEVEIYVGKPILFDQRMLDRQKANAELQRDKFQEVLDKLALIEAELKK